ncbi:VRR-NUC domain-containing protein [Paraburkholderia diazotrophica]|uniref:phosphodiesterase I n=1 Tax=Paraburkholderia diazotrophica TaxID=667676 RepID=A0A1H6W7P0_9BURK|nr:VRR-NUC domain-containing protein [Paraburkholderia diazotrophica]SEJ08305.1 VRR-NUC domain-containing protein [Paraburkholderia diazotrophica]
MPTDAPDPYSGSPFYYLLNFERALAWIAGRYDDLLDDGERAFLHTFLNDRARLPRASRALLVRMLMRKGTLFRTGRLAYAEIGCPVQAAAPLAALGWIDADAHVSLDELFALATRPELQRIFADAPAPKSARKAEWLEALRADADHAADAMRRRYREWDAASDEAALRVLVAPLCERFRLMFFGNLHQDWSEFVLADLGVFQYEHVAFADSSRAFQQRADVDCYLALHACREALELTGGDALEPLLEAINAIDTQDNAWLALRRAKLLFAIGQYAERRHDWDAALHVYARCAWPGARHRRMRVLERAGRDAQALALALQAADKPESEEELQRLARIVPRLQRRLGLAVHKAVKARAAPRSMLELPRPADPLAVEYIARDHLSTDDAPVHYVENALINSLFGLLCWEPVFAAVPGAFFHPFQRGPADLHAPDFRARRAAQFDACFAQLDNGEYRATIQRHFESKTGLQSPFVFWGVLTHELLTLALDCLPAAHLKRWFERLLSDVRANRSGLPDLIRFWPRERRYELIEVKGPGDRLQDNQIRWLEYCVQHRMPVSVLDVRWVGGNDDANAIASVDIGGMNDISDISDVSDIGDTEAA